MVAKGRGGLVRLRRMITPFAMHGVVLCSVEARLDLEDLTEVE